ncbi:hypothetical protein CXB51_023175 [Gossypium anomalum]|uniref:Non-specific lipid-transfer protein n=1 Tax=Gossypium anomalum TaxID=47600 RepID=A0A8J5YJZ2_9ROSI|nr:hypothetical protein CXB51_023175 [Gossypium anomalum]
MALKLACGVVLCLVVGAPLAEGAISCGQVISALAPCIPYVRNNGAGGVPAPCCNGIRSLNTAAQSTPERQSACNCVKALAASISGINYDLTNKLPVSSEVGHMEARQQMGKETMTYSYIIKMDVERSMG